MIVTALRLGVGVSVGDEVGIAVHGKSVVVGATVGVWVGRASSVAIGRFAVGVAGGSVVGDDRGVGGRARGELTTGTLVAVGTCVANGISGMAQPTSRNAGPAATTARFTSENCRRLSVLAAHGAGFLEAASVRFDDRCWPTLFRPCRRSGTMCDGYRTDGLDPCQEQNSLGHDIIGNVRKSQWIGVRDNGWQS
jgi:hypothetical protein